MRPSGIFGNAEAYVLLTTQGNLFRRSITYRRPPQTHHRGTRSYMTVRSGCGGLGVAPGLRLLPAASRFVPSMYPMVKFLLRKFVFIRVSVITRDSGFRNDGSDSSTTHPGNLAREDRSLASLSFLLGARNGAGSSTGRELPHVADRVGIFSGPRNKCVTATRGNDRSDLR